MTGSVARQESPMQPIAVGLIIATFASHPTVVPVDNNGRAEMSAPARTAKERLTDKASDEQRLDDCKVSPARRTRARPTACQAR
jgi:hypothetical protein